LGSSTLRSSRESFLAALAPARGEKILDVGAGRGAVAARVLGFAPGSEVFAVDPNEKRVAAMRRDHPQLRSSVARAESLPFADSFFDKAYTTMALHHYSDLDAALRELARVLKPGGSFIVVEVDPRSAKGRLFGFFGRWTGEHLSLMSEKDLAAKLGSAAGFRLVSSLKLGSDYLIQLTRS
jgi:ubiquinone/menaquinone biosynthesis C-methylase UbiE